MPRPYGFGLGLQRRRSTAGAATAGASLPLDSLSSVAASWSVPRRLRTAYTGPLIRVRRSMDNAEQDIGYTATNDLDTTALLNFVGVPARPLDALSVSAAAAYGPRRLRTAYTGPALRVRRSLDNAERDIGFTTANDIDATALQAWCGVNSLPNSETITAAANWQLIGVTTALNGAAGDDNIWLMAEDATTAKHRIGSPSAGVAFTAGAAITIEVEVRAAGRSLVQILSGSALTAAAINYDLTALTLALRGGGVSGTITDIGDSWRLLSFTVTPGTSASAAVFLQIIQAMTDSRDPLGYAGTAGLGVEVRRFRWRVSATQGAYTPTFGTAITALQDGLVTTLYDQSGNGRNATQTTVANQPQIVVAGVLATLNGKTVLRGINGTSSLTLASGISGLTDYTISTVLQKTASTNDIIFGNAALNEQLLRINSGNNPLTFWGTVATSSSVWDVTTTAGVVNFVRSGATVTPYLNGTAGAAMTQTLSAVTFSGIGVFAGNTGNLGALVGEVLVFNSALSTVDRQILEQSQSVYYGITYAPGLPSGFVTTLYDQSGNSVNATQTTVANQPRIVNAGAIAANINGRPAVAGDGVDDGLTFPLTGMTAYPLSTNIVVSGTSTNNLGCWVKIGTSNGIGIGQGNTDFSTANVNIRLLKESVVWMGTSTPVAASAVLSYVQPPGSTASTLFQNGQSVTIGNATSVPLAPTVSGALIGHANVGNRFSTNPISEIVIFNSALSTADRQTLERDQGSYYGITVA